QMAGGFTANAYSDQIEVKRYAEKGARDALTLNFSQSHDQQTKVKDGDAVNVLKKNEELTRYVQIEGDVRHPGFIEWKSGLRIADLFQSVDTSF
ncbi:SLBB domain-containing protein, partial [Vibrio parahaemolyticus]